MKANWKGNRVWEVRLCMGRKGTAKGNPERDDRKEREKVKGE